MRLIIIQVTLVQLDANFYMLEVKPEHLIGDRAYESDGLDADLQQDCVNLTAPHRSSRKLKTEIAGPSGAINAADSLNGSLLGSSGAATPHSLGILRSQFSRICATRLHHDAPQTILR
jgi:hypothetical protein